MYVGERSAGNDGVSVDAGSVSCAPGFTLSSPEPVVCHGNGSWQRPFPECLPDSERESVGVPDGDDVDGSAVWNGTAPLELDDNYKQFTVSFSPSFSVYSWR